ncbi:MAG: hypothetical protein JEY97_04020 [Bacteroidales bacterium]|nr:hypothetical protein [Bacteroidales bacterium]
MKKTILLLILCYLLGNITQAQIVRGAVPCEIYLAHDWYLENGIIHKGIFHSTDNGENITLQYEATDPPTGGAIGIGRVLGDATPGSLYNYNDHELWVSLDYGANWEYKEYYSYASYATGFYNGEIYRRSNYNLYRSENYGENFDLIVESLTEPLSDVGNQEGELFGFTGLSGVGFNLYHSIDYGQNFSTILIDSSIAYWAPSGLYPKISRGTEPGELYLVSWWPDYHYKIFHSVDTGYTWTEKFESEYINIFYWSLSFTAGRQQGSFYVSRITYDYATQYSLVYIDYSSDYGETFTTFFHGPPSPQPSNYPENFSAHNIELEWNDPVNGILPHANLVLMSDISFEAIEIPVDNVAVPDSDIAKNIPYGEEKCLFTNLIPATVYYFKIFPYTVSGGEINYKTDEGGIQTMKMTKE